MLTREAALTLVTLWEERCPQEVSRLFLLHLSHETLTALQNPQDRLHSHFTDEETNSESGPVIRLLKVSGQSATRPNLEPKTSDFSNSTYYAHLPPGHRVKVKPEPDRCAKKCFSLVLLTPWKQIFTGTHVHSIINQESVIRSIKPQRTLRGTVHTEGIEMSANRPHSLTSIFIECSLCPWYSAWDTEQIKRTKICPCGAHISGA